MLLIVLIHLFSAYSISQMSDILTYYLFYDDPR
uniref:Uncharacterized protein n=1 Tax=Arundo donax TaxID=35708 RepID=A0A0A9ARC5_ARUDO